MSGTERTPASPEVEVATKATRRRFTLEYKRKIVREADGCKTPGAVGALLVQQRAPSQRSWAADALRRASRTGRAARRGAGSRAHRGICRASGTVPRRPASPAGAACGGMDQSPQDPKCPCRHHRGPRRPRLLALTLSPSLSSNAAPWEAKKG
jgi:hypothetical protein